VKLELFIAKRHLTKRSFGGFISMNFFISIAGVALGVMALIVVLSVMSGFDRELKSKIVGVQPHILVEKVGGVDEVAQTLFEIQKLGIKDIISVAPYVQGQAIVRSDAYATGVIVRGVDIQSEDLDLVRKNMRSGALAFTEVPMQVKRWFGKVETRMIGRVLVGESLAAALSVRVGDIVSVISPDEDKPSKLTEIRKTKSDFFQIGGIFRLGMNDFDSSLALISLPHAQSIYHLEDRVSGIGIRVKDVELADKVKEEIQDHFDSPFVFQSWIDLNRHFFSALKVEKTVMTILLSLIILVAAFNIVSSLTMVAMEKTKDIGILRALGATASSIREVFLIEGLMIGVTGVFLGAILGLWLTLHLNEVSDFLEKAFGISVFPSDIYYFDKIPAQINSGDIVTIVLSALVMALAAGIYPAHQAAQLHPVEALRHE